MALVKYGPGISAMSGSIGGSTFARNRFGNYIRTRTKPTNPNTASQVQVRSALAYCTERWSGTLTAPQRTAWNLYASSVTMKNRLGENINLTGFNHYVRSNMLLKLGLATLVDDGPTTFELPEKDPTFAVTGTEAAQTVSLAYDDTMDWADENGAFLHVFQGQPQNAQRNFFAGPWLRLGSLPGANGAPPASPLVLAVRTVITEGQRLWMYARIQRADGRLSEKFFCDTFVAA